jgi:hypothetical protein
MVALKFTGINSSQVDSKLTTTNLTVKHDYIYNYGTDM